MPFSAVPELIDAIVAAAADALPDVNVSDAWYLGEDPGDVLMIGTMDADFEVSQTSAEASKDFATTGLDGTQHETGEIACVAISWTGDPQDQKTPRDNVYAIANAVDQLCRVRGGTDPAFGVPYVLWTRCGASSQLLQPPGDGGRIAFLLFRIYFEARP